MVLANQVALWAVVFAAWTHITRADFLPLVVRQTNSQVAEIIEAARSSRGGDVTQSLHCLEIYQPMLDELAKKLEAETGACLRESEAAREAVDRKWDNERSRLESINNDACSRFDECNKETSPLDFFKCTSEGSEEAYKQAQMLFSAANKAETALLSDYEVVHYTEHKCADAASSKYQKESDKVSVELQKCISG